MASFEYQRDERFSFSANEIVKQASWTDRRRNVCYSCDRISGTPTFVDRFRGEETIQWKLYTLDPSKPIQKNVDYLIRKKQPSKSKWLDKVKSGCILNSCQGYFRLDRHRYVCYLSYFYDRIWGIQLLCQIFVIL